jgi:hypothetical protein
MIEVLIGKHSAAIYLSVSPHFAAKCLCCNQRDLLGELGMIRTHMGSTVDQKMVPVAWDALYDTTP